MSGKKDEGGSPLGALAGFAMAGPIGAIFGWKVGRQVAASIRAALDEMLPELEGALQHFDEFDPQRRAEIVGMLAKMHTQYGQLNRLAQQRYQTRVSAIHGMAARAGIDWRP